MMAIFKDGKCVSKCHSTLDAVLQEGFEMKALYRDNRGKFQLHNGYSIEDVVENAIGHLK